MCYDPAIILQQRECIQNFEVQRDCTIEEFSMRMRFEVKGLADLSEFALYELAIQTSSLAPERQQAKCH